MNDPLASLHGKFNVKQVGRAWHIRCTGCTAAWSLPVASEVRPGNLLHLLNHFYGHRERARTAAPVNAPHAGVHQYNDGGRKQAGYTGSTGDCVVRAISIAAELPYQEVYDALNQLAQSERITKRRRRTSNSRLGVHRVTYDKYIRALGWEWTPTMQIGSGCKVHLRADELPAGRLIVSVSRHLVAVIDGVIQDTHDCSRGGTRCVYGYWRKR